MLFVLAPVFFFYQPTKSEGEAAVSDSLNWELKPPTSSADMFVCTHVGKGI